MTGPAVDVEQIERLLEAATPGPWYLELDTEAVPHIVTGSRYVCGPADEYADTELIFAAVTQLPALLDLIRRQDAALTAVRELADDWLEGRTVIDASKQIELIAAAAALASPDTTQEA